VGDCIIYHSSGSQWQRNAIPVDDSVVVRAFTVSNCSNCKESCSYCQCWREVQSAANAPQFRSKLQERCLLQRSLLLRSVRLLYFSSFSPMHSWRFHRLQDSGHSPAISQVDRSFCLGTSTGDFIFRRKNSDGKRRREKCYIIFEG
jgi:hypothetical protein